jgi:hypothetical protein
MSSGSASSIAAPAGVAGREAWARTRGRRRPLERDALVAGAGDVLARIEAAGEAEGLALDEVLGRGGRLDLRDDLVDVGGLRVALAAVAGDRDGGDGLAGVRGARLDGAREAAVAGEGDADDPVLGVRGRS